jgi:PAS domain S-box-containing protein
VRVLIVDDHERVRRGVRLLLSRMVDVEVCGEAINGMEAVAAARQLHPHVIVMDIDIPALNGIEATRQIRRAMPHVQIIMMSLYDIPKAKEEALRAGAVAYVTKSSVWELLPILQKMQAGDASPGIARESAPSDEAEISHDRDLENVVRDREECFRSAFEQMDVGMGHVDRDGRWLRANQKLCDIVGYSKKEIEQLRLQDITHPADLAAGIALDHRIACGELDHYFAEKRYIRKDGRIAWIHLTVNAVRDTGGKLKYCLHVAEEVAAAKEAQEKLAQAKRELQIAAGHLELVAEQINVPLTRCSRDLRYVWVNRNYADWLQRPVEKIVGRSILDVVGKEAFERLQPYFDQVLAGKKVSCEESVTYDRIGSRRILAAYSPTRDAAGVVDGWLAFVQDITNVGKPAHV